MRNEIFKTPKDYPYVSVNHDGSVIYVDGKLRKVQQIRGNPYDKKYKIVTLRNRKRINVARLVYMAFIGELPRSRAIKFIDGNEQNTNYKNLLPKPAIFKRGLKRIPGFDEAFINANGTQVIQYGLEVNITAIKRKNSGVHYICCLNTNKGTKSVYISNLVAYAWNGWRGKGRIIHIDKNISNNHYENLKALTEKQFRKYLFDNYFRFNCNTVKKSKLDKHTAYIKKRLLRGDSLKSIANDFNTSDMAISRFKYRHLSADEISRLHVKKHVVNDKLSPETVEAIVNDLKAGLMQCKAAQKYGVTPSTICRINRKHIRKC